jgi:hypothetical protein
MKTMNDLIEIDDFLDPSDIDALLKIAINSTEEEWNLFNETTLNGPFWDGKRLMIDQGLSINLGKRLSEVFDNKYWITAPNKIQRFYQNDNLGPLIDAEHGELMTYGSILFLHDDIDDDGIIFPQLNKNIKPKTNKLVVYSSDIQYIIPGPKNDAKKYFITVFFNKESNG